MDLGSGIRKKPIPDPGSRGQKGTDQDSGSGSATLDPTRSGYTTLELRCLKSHSTQLVTVTHLELVEPELVRVFLEQEGEQLLVQRLVGVELALGHVPGRSVRRHDVVLEHLHTQTNIANREKNTRYGTKSLKERVKYQQLRVIGKVRYRCVKKNLLWYLLW
jgi:hypothetical protein